MEFKASGKDFKKAVRLIMSGRTEFVDKDTADFTIVADELNSLVYFDTGDSLRMNLDFSVSSSYSHAGDVTKLPP